MLVQFDKSRPCCVAEDGSLPGPGALLASAVWRYCTAERSAREVVGARPERLKHQKDECQNLFCISQLAFTSATGVKTTSKALARQLNIFRARL